VIEVEVQWCNTGGSKESIEGFGEFGIAVMEEKAGLGQPICARQSKVELRAQFRLWISVQANESVTGDSMFFNHLMATFEEASWSDQEYEQNPGGEHSRERSRN
jgi:hypothetical protein